jgi:hypothetical protein
MLSLYAELLPFKVLKPDTGWPNAATVFGTRPPAIFLTCAEMSAVAPVADSMAGTAIRFMVRLFRQAVKSLHFRPARYRFRDWICSIKCQKGSKQQGNPSPQPRHGTAQVASSRSRSRSRFRCLQVEMRAARVACAKAWPPRAGASGAASRLHPESEAHYALLAFARQAAPLPRRHPHLVGEHPPECRYGLISD